MTQSKSSRETINSGLKKCVSDVGVRAKLEGMLNRPERSYISIKTICIAVSVLGIIAVGGWLLSSQIAKKKLDKGRVRMQLIV